jgi:hypothetical protein
MHQTQESQQGYHSKGAEHHGPVIVISEREYGPPESMFIIIIIIIIIITIITIIAITITITIIIIIIIIITIIIIVGIIMGCLPSYPNYRWTRFATLRGRP